MQNDIPKEDVNEEELEYEEEVKFGYIPSIIFLIFIGFIIYISTTS